MEPVYSLLLQASDPQVKQNFESLPLLLGFIVNFVEGQLRNANLARQTRVFVSSLLLPACDFTRLSDMSHVEWKSIAADDGFHTALKRLSIAHRGHRLIQIPEPTAELWRVVACIALAPR